MSKLKLNEHYQKVITIIIAIFLAALTSLGCIFPALTGFADDDGLAFDKTNVMDDLNSSVVEGQAFDLKTFNFDSKKELQILSFVEYGYSFYADLQDNFGLYIYVYNPQGLKLESDSELNGITIAFDESSSARFNHFALEFLSKSEESNYNGLFYKFKVNMSRTQKQEALDALNSTERVYRIGQLLLKQKSNTNATAFAVGNTYKVNGYSKGYGPDEEADSTLAIARGEQQETIQLDVQPAYYRPEGTIGISGRDKYTRDSLHCVYFAVPNKYEEEYELMVAVHAKWLDAVLKPMLVTGNEEVYKALLPYLGKTITESCYPPYVYSTYYEKVHYDSYLPGNWGAIDNLFHLFSYYYVFRGTMYGNVVFKEIYEKYKSLYEYDPSLVSADYCKYVDTLYGLFPTSDFSNNSADTYRVSPSAMKTWLESTKSKYGGGLVNGKYSKEVFESITEDWTDKTYTSDYKYQDGEYVTFDLRSRTLDSKWYHFFVDQGDIVNNDFKDLKCIQKVEGLTGTAAIDCAEYFLDEVCYEEFKNYYNAKKTNNSIYIFRYQVSDYYSAEATCVKRKSDSYSKVDTNAYFFQETVNLDFTVIDLTFRNGSEYTVIPVVANPVDNIPGSTEPSDTNKDGDDKWWKEVIEWLKKILAIVLIVLVVVILAPLFPHVINLIVWIFKGVIWLLTLPFKLISKIIKSFKKKE